LTNSPSLSSGKLASRDEFSYNLRVLFDERHEFRASYRKVVEMLGNMGS
jgi:hypothetical protein